MNDFATIWLPIILMIVGAFLGACFSIGLPRFLSTRRYQRRDDLLGEWSSTWQDADDPNQWVTETVHIDVADGRLRLRNSSNVGGYRWEGVCELYGDHYLYGTWKSLKKAAPSTGVFSFLTLPQGDVLVGQAMGQDRFGVARTSDWILARQKTDIDIGKQWLCDHATYYRGGP
jgi:hypothetical protein